MTIGTFHIFKPGTHTSMANQELSFTPRELQEAAAAFSENIRPAPLVLGHPTHDAPAMGWVKRLTFKDNGLYATADFGEELVSHVKAKRYPAVSSAFLSKDDARNPTPGRWYLRHVGFLGAIPPAVKGLKPVTFAEVAWSSPAIAHSQDMELAFAEARASGLDEADSERQMLHARAQALMKRNPGMGYAAAAHRAHADIEGHKERQAKSSGMDPDRVAFHEAALDYQASHPHMSYATAINHIFSHR